MNDYNGWPNRETWNANLWLFCNDQDTYAQANMIMGFTGSPVTLADRAIGLSRLAKHLWGTETPDGCPLEAVDWNAIALANQDD